MDPPLVSQPVVMYPVVVEGNVHLGLSVQPAKECSPPAVVQESAGFVPEYSFAVSHVTLHCADVLVPVHPVVM